MKVSKILDAVQEVANDTDGVTYTDDQVIGWIEDAIRALLSKRPDALVETRFVDLVAGTRQTLPGDAHKLFGVIRNLNGPAIRGPVSQEELDAFNPDWHLQSDSDLYPVNDSDNLLKTPNDFSNHTNWIGRADIGDPVDTAFGSIDTSSISSSKTNEVISPNGKGDYSKVVSVHPSFVTSFQQSVLLSYNIEYTASVYFSLLAENEVNSYPAFKMSFHNEDGTVFESAVIVPTKLSGSIAEDDFNLSGGFSESTTAKIEINYETSDVRLILSGESNNVLHTHVSISVIPDYGTSFISDGAAVGYNYFYGVQLEKGAVATKVFFVDEYIYNISNPLEYLVIPPVTDDEDASSSVELQIAVNQTPITDAESDDIPVIETYSSALIEWCLYRLFSRDNEKTPNYVRAGRHFGNFFTVLGEKIDMDMAVDPKVVENL